MRNMILNSYNRKNGELFSVTLWLSLYLTHTAVPFFKYPFLIIYILITIYILVMYRDRIFSGLKDLKNILPVVLVLFLYLTLACFFSNKIYLMIVKDIVNIIILLSIILVLKLFIHESKDCILFYQSFLNLAVLFAFLISVQRIYSYFYLSSYSQAFNDLYVNKDRAVVDSNFVLIPVFFGLIGILYTFSQKISRLKILIYNILLIIFSISFLISGSKRGVFLFLLLFIMILAIQLWSLFSNNLRVKQLSKISKYYLLSFSILVILLIFLILNTSVYFKNSVLESIGVNNIPYTKNLITETFFRYFHFLDKDLNEEILYSKIWKPVFDPKDPEVWSGTGNYKIVKSLSGKNVEIVPAGSKGYLFDKSCLGFASPSHSYYFLSLKRESVKKGDSLLASVYCYVTDNFDGDAVAIRAEGSLTGNPDKFYDLKNKGCWQKLILPISCSQGDIIIYLYMNKGGVEDFSNLKGYVIFAFPEFNIVSNGSNISNSLIQSNNYKKIFIKGIKYNDSKLKMNYESLVVKNIYKASFLKLSISELFSQINNSADTDPLRNWIRKIVSEDTIYHPYKSNLFVKKSLDDFGEDRIARWKIFI